MRISFEICSIFDVLCLAVSMIVFPKTVIFMKHVIGFNMRVWRGGRCLFSSKQPNKKVLEEEEVEEQIPPSERTPEESIPKFEKNPSFWGKYFGWALLNKRVRGILVEMAIMASTGGKVCNCVCNCVCLFFKGVQDSDQPPSQRRGHPISPH